MTDAAATGTGAEVRKTVSATAYERLADLAARKPRVALMGEFSAGKSTLLNQMIGDEIARTQVVATHLPNLWLSHGPAAAELVFEDRAPVRADGPWPAHPELGAARAVRLWREAPLLEHVDLIDTPGISDPLMPPDLLRWVERRVDLVLWCTPGPQAWRQSEKLAWLDRPDRLRRRSLLVVTQADRLGAYGCARVRKRLESEAGGLFAGLFATSIRRGAGGGEDLDALISRVIAAAGEIRAERAAMLARYRIAETSPSPTPQPRATDPRSLDAPQTAADPARAVDLLALWDAIAAPSGPDTDPATAFSRFHEALAAEDPDRDWTRAPWFALARSATACGPAPAASLLNQMRGEIADFAENDWCDLATASGPCPRDGSRARDDAPGGAVNTQNAQR